MLKELVNVKSPSTIKKLEDMKLAAIDFANGMLMQDVLNKYNVCYASVYNALERFNIPYTKTYGRQIFFNEKFFEGITTEHQAYWLGFIMADGCIVKTDLSLDYYNRMVITLSTKDKCHLDSFKETINYTGHLLVYTQHNTFGNTNACAIHCNSKKMVSDLIKLGCLPNKTGYSHMPSIPQNLICHFIRGYFDGDGCITIYTGGDGYRRQEFSITTDETILKEMQIILAKECNLQITKLQSYKRTKLAFSLKYGGRLQIIRIFNYLYNNDTASIFLERKYNKFKLLLSQ